MNYKYLFLLVFLIGCTTKQSAYQPKFKVGDCYTTTTSDCEKWEKCKRVYRKVIEIGNKRYHIKTFYEPYPYIDDGSSMFDFEIQDRLSSKVTCPKELERF